jgi:hypothetical protein
LLLLKIHEAISLRRDVPVVNDALWNTDSSSEQREFGLFESKDILKLVPNTTSYATYHSAIGLKLAAAYTQPASEVVRHLAETLRQTVTATLEEDDASTSSILRNLTVTFNDAGILYFKFHDRAIALWLKFLIDTKIYLNNPVESPQYASTEAVWAGQLAHARCCGLLRLGSPLDTQAIEWLTPQGQLRLTLPAERQLVQQLVAIVDALSLPEPPKKCLKRLQDLTAAFDRCDRACQILGDRAGIASGLAQCRLGLIMITRSLFWDLLTQKLGVAAPTEL